MEYLLRNSGLRSLRLPPHQEAPQHSMQRQLRSERIPADSRLEPPGWVPQDADHRSYGGSSAPDQALAANSSLRTFFSTYRARCTPTSPGRMGSSFSMLRMP